jgi:hypothetical protein
MNASPHPSPNPARPSAREMDTTPQAAAVYYLSAPRAQVFLARNAEQMLRLARRIA